MSYKMCACDIVTKKKKKKNTFVHPNVSFGNRINHSQLSWFETT